ncbi:MAG: hypothetical protein ACLP2Y_08640 [Limisphaerales bacterium]
MRWINLFAVILVLGYALWIACRGWRLFGKLRQASTISDVLKSILEQHRFYFIHGAASFIALLAFLGLRVLVLLFTSSEATVFSPFVFGSFAYRFLPGKLGCLGVALLVISLVCFYQHVKSKHYLHVLYAFRNQLGLTEAG